MTTTHKKIPYPPSSPLLLLLQPYRNLYFTGAEPNARDDDGRTPLHHAASNGRREVIAVLLGFGGDVSAADRELDTPLHCAAREKQRLAVSLLESAGADPEATNCWGLLAGTLAPHYKMNPAGICLGSLVGGGGLFRPKQTVPRFPTWHLGLV